MSTSAVLERPLGFLTLERPFRHAGSVLDPTEQTGRVTRSAARPPLGKGAPRGGMSDQRKRPPDLLPRIASGDGTAVEACLQRYSPLVWSLARRMWKEVTAVEDVVQEIFIEIWKSAARFDASKASETTFIATIARRRIIDRRRRISSAPPQEGMEEREMPVEEEGFERIDIGDEALRARAALDQLKPEQRRVILMSVVDGLTHQEVAQATGLPLGTVKSHIRRGLDKAAQLLRAPRGEGAS